MLLLLWLLDVLGKPWNVFENKREGHEPMWLGIGKKGINSNAQTNKYRTVQATAFKILLHFLNNFKHKSSFPLSEEFRFL